MLLIAHRGNTAGKKIAYENKPKYLEHAINEGFDVEVDIWKVGTKLMLGHDKPETEITNKWLDSYKQKLWMHCKNGEALERLLSFDSYNYFFHQSDKYTLTSKGYIWILADQQPLKGGIVVLPETTEWARNTKILREAGGICTDECQMYRKLVENHNI